MNSLSLAIIHFYKRKQHYSTEFAIFKTHVRFY